MLTLSKLPNLAAGRALAAVILLLVLAHAPSLFLGFVADDYGQELVLSGEIEAPHWRPWSLYDFGSVADVAPDSPERAGFPWWTDEDWSVRFLRPLTSLSRWLDHRVFGPNAFAGHVVNLALFAALLLAVRRLHLSLGLSPRAATIALFVFAVDGGALMPVGWLANRNSLLEALFAALAVGAALRAIPGAGASSGPVTAGSAGSGARRPIGLPLLLAMLAVASKESGVHVLAVLALVFLGFGAREPARSRRRPAAALFAVGLAGAYTLGFAALGYGSNSLFYPTPWGAPREFLTNAAQTLVAAPLAAVTPLPLDLFVLFPEHATGLFAAALFLAVPLVAILARVLVDEPAARLCALWGVLALLPQAGAPPSDRLLFTALVPWSAPIALFLERALFSGSSAGDSGVPVSRARPSRTARAIAWTVAGLLALGYPLFVAVGAGFARAADGLRAAIREAEVGPPLAAGEAERDVFLLQASPSSLVALGPWPAWRFHGGDPRVRFFPLQGGQRALAWTRTGERTFTLESRDESFLDLPFERVFRTRAASSSPRTWRTRLFTVVETAPEDGTAAVGDSRGPRRLEFRFEAPLEDPRFVFLAWRDGRLARVAPPAIGTTLELPRGFRDPMLP